MKNRSIAAAYLFALALQAIPAAHAAPTVVTFEDLGGGVIDDGYGGIAGWRDAGYVRENRFIPGGQGDYSYGGWNSAPGSGYGHDDGASGLRFVNGPVILDGLYFFNADVPAGVETGILLYYQGQLVHRIADPRTASLAWVASGYRGLVDTVYFAAGYDGYVIDDLTYSSASAVPEPAVPWILAGGATCLLGLSWRRQRAGRPGR